MTDTTDKKPDPIVLAIDIGGSHVKMRLSNGGEDMRDVSGPNLTPRKMMNIIKKLTKGRHFDVVSMGYPGPVIHNRILAEPYNLGKGWVKFDFKKAFGKPRKVVNDALMQAIGNYEGGRMLFLGLGTGLGAAMIVENVAQPMELAHLPYKKGKTFEDYAGERGLKKFGKKKWRKNVFDIVTHVTAALEPDTIVIGGGNATLLDKLPPKCKIGANTNAFIGGFRLWQDKDLRV
jgi:polyphosphate glucokinase